MHSYFTKYAEALHHRVASDDLIAVQHATKSLFYARDPLGRRSLLMRIPDSINPSFILASTSLGHLTSAGNHFEEVSPNYIHQIHLDRIDFIVRPQWRRTMLQLTIRVFRMKVLDMT